MITTTGEDDGPAGAGLPRASWHKSSYSGGNGDCVEVADLGEHIAIRDSKDRTGPVLVVGRETWHTFVQDVGAGTCDL